MDIGSIIKGYRQRNNISLRDFATKCGTSHSYIAMLEAGKNSKTGEPIVPSLIMLNKIAKGLGMTINELVEQCDDMPISLTMDDKKPTDDDGELSENRKKLIQFAQTVPEDKVDLVIRIMKSILEET